MSEHWRKSSRSDDDNGNCVEVRHDLAAVRDSKAPGAGVVEAGRDALAALTVWVRQQ